MKEAIILASLLVLAPLAHAQSMPGMSMGGAKDGMAAGQGTAMPPKNISVQDCWIRLLPGSAPSAGYFTIENSGDQPVSLAGAHADAFGMADDGFALQTEFLDQRAYTQFIVAVAALECVDFGMNQRFEFGRTGDRPLDALVHGGDFAANGLADRHDALGCGRFRLGKTQGNLGHGTGGAAQFLGARNHDGKGEEQQHWQDDENRHANGARHGRHVGK